MKSIVFISDEKVSNSVVENISKYNENMEIIIVDNTADCVQRSGDCNYAFIGFYDDEIPAEKVIANLAQNGTSTYYIVEKATEELFDMVINAGGKKVIGLSNLEQEIRVIMKAANRAAGNEVYSEPIRQSQSKRIDIRSIELNENEQPKIQKITGTKKSLSLDEIVRAKKYPGAIISIHGGKGGLGKTTVTGNLAVALAMQKLKVIAVDLDVENGNLADVLHLVGEKTIKDWIKGNFHEEDDAVVTHESGLKVIPGIKMAAESELITAEATERILSRLARRYDVVVVDTGAIEIEPMLMAMKMADRSYVVGDYDMSKMKNLIKLINNAKILHIDTNKMKLVMNQVPNTKIPEKQDILNNISLQLLTEIKKDEAVLSAINRGYTPYSDRRCKYIRAGIDRILEDILVNTDIGKKINGGVNKQRAGGWFKWKIR